MKESNKEKEKIFYSQLQNEMDIYYNYHEIRNRTLEELHLIKPEIDLFLNKLERVYNVCICEGEISLDISFAGLVHILPLHSRSTEPMNEAEFKCGI